MLYCILLGALRNVLNWKNVLLGGSLFKKKKLLGKNHYNWKIRFVSIMLLIFVAYF